MKKIVVVKRGIQCSVKLASESDLVKFLSGTVIHLSCD